MRVTRLNFAAVALAACICLALGLPAFGGEETVLKVRVGWDERVRPGHWTPIFIEATDPKPQNAVVEINAAEGSLYSMQVRQFFTIGPIASTLTLYVPLQSGYGDGPVVVIRDEQGKTMARYPPDQENSGFHQQVVGGGNRFVGVSGLRTSLRVMQGQIQGETWEIGWLEPELLPETPLGYDSLDLLVLNAPDLLHLRGPQQQAIVDWVRGGGHLILWPNDDPAPRSSPLVDVLPCTIAGPHTVHLSESDLNRIGLPRRYSGIRGRLLTPRPETKPVSVDLFGTGSPEDAAYRRTLGLGSIFVAPVNLSQLEFNTSSPQFWVTMLDGAGAARANNDGTAIYNDIDPYTRRQYKASQTLEDFLGNVPGAGKFGFSYVALVLLGMMVVVGPVDWFVLRKLGRQPWTWVTTTGWIVLITGGAVFIGHVFKSGKLHYGSVRVIDQADGATVGETSLTGIYSPRTTSYHLDAVPGDLPSAGAGPPGPAAALPPPGWWSVASTEEYGSRGGMANDISFHQTDEGNDPEDMLINVWNLRFLREESMHSGPPMIDANLAPSTTFDGRQRIAGVIRNLTDKTLTNVRVRVASGVSSSSVVIAPGGSVNFDMVVNPGSSGLFPEQSQEMYSPYYNNNGNQVIPADELWHVAGDLSAVRTHRIESLLKTGNFACVYADCPDCQPPAALREAADGHADQQHYEMIRALVPLASAAAVTAPQGPNP